MVALVIAADLPSGDATIEAQVTIAQATIALAAHHPLITGAIVAQVIIGLEIAVRVVRLPVVRAVASTGPVDRIEIVAVKIAGLPNWKNALATCSAK